MRLRVVAPRHTRRISPFLSKVLCWFAIRQFERHRTRFQMRLNRLLKRTHIYGTALYPSVAVKVGGGRHRRIAAGIQAGRTRL